jgi:hypothetical protein
MRAVIPSSAVVSLMKSSFAARHTLRPEPPLCLYGAVVGESTCRRGLSRDEVARMVGEFDGRLNVALRM